MRRRFQSLVRNTSGATAVEFALVIFPLLLLLLGIFETGRLFWTHHALQETAISGARCMGLRASDCPVHRSFIQDAAKGWGIVLTDTEIYLNGEIGDDEISCDSETFSRVRIVHKFSSVLPVLAGSQVSAEACFPNQPPSPDA